MKRDDKPTTTMPTAPYVDPTVAARNPGAAAYAARIAARMGGDPRGGPPTPPIPRLDMPHQAGMTMADQAVAARPPVQGPAPGGIFTADQASAVAMSMSRGLLPTDTMPDAARQDPMWREGHGSMYAMNQPKELVEKYGVIRNGQFVPPQQVSTGRPGLSQKTVEGLKAVQEFNEQRRAVESGDAAAEKAAQEGIAGLGSTAQLAGGDSKPVTDAERNAQKEALQSMDDFDFNSFRELMMKDLLNNDAQREIVEARLKPLDLTELIVNGRISQVVPIRPGQYEPEFQSFTGEEELALKRLLMEERQTLAAPDRYLLDKFQLMTVALGITAVNKHPFPTHLVNGKFDDEAFWKKYNMVTRMPFHMLASLGVHYYWFDVRVRKLFVAERLGNG